MVADGERRRLAFRRRLADGPRQRWAWAVGSGLPVVGLPVLLVHAVTRRTGVPLLFGLGALGQDRAARDAEAWFRLDL